MRSRWSGPVCLARRLMRGLLDTLLPPLCPGCEVDLVGSRWLCGACRRALRPVPERWVCWLCRGEEAARGREAGLGCEDPEHRSWWGRAAFWMEPPLDALIHALKYGNRPDLAPPLGRLLATQVPLTGDGVVAIPLHRTRRRERGYNQAGLLAEASGRLWGVPVIEGLLVRSRSTAAQARLRGSDRSRNVGSAFRAGVPSWANGRSFILLDDVGTSGSTLRAAAAPLLEAGAERVIPVTLALA